MATLSQGVDTFALLAEPDASHNTLGFLTVEKDAAVAYIYFPVVARPNNSSVASATLRLFTSGSWGLTPTVTATLAATAWGGSGVTWNNQPGVTGTPVTESHASAADGDPFEFDVTSLVSDALTDGLWYGLVVKRTDVGASRSFYSHEDSDLPPTLEVLWTVTPDPPSSLSPSGGRAVATPTPTVTLNGAADVTWVQVQVDGTADDFSSPEFDSGWVPSTVPELDLSTTAFGGLSAGVDKSVRAQYKNSSGVASGWSPTSHMTYQPYGGASFVYPSDSSGQIVTSNTPTLTAESGGTVASWVMSVALADSPLDVLYRTKVADPTIAAALPGPTLTSSGYKPGTIADSAPLVAILEVTDDYDREAVPGFPVAEVVTQEFSFQATTAVPPVAGFYVLQVETSPFNDLVWTDLDDEPDKYVIRRDEQIIMDLDPDDPTVLIDADGDRHWIDYTAAGGTVHHYRVSRKVGGQVSGDDPTFDILTTPEGKWLGDPWRQDQIQLWGDDIGQWAQGETSALYYPLRGPDTVRVNQTTRGYAGDLTGYLRPDDYVGDGSVARYYRALQNIRRFPSRTYVVALPYIAFYATLSSATAEPAPSLDERWNVSVHFEQQGATLWAGSGDFVGSGDILLGEWDYEEGVDGTNLTTVTNVGSNGVSGTVKYKAAAKIHGDMGFETGTGGPSAGLVSYPCEYIGKASVYLTPKQSSGAGSAFRLDTAFGAGQCAYFVLKSGGDLAIANGAFTNVASSHGTGGWLIDSAVRLDAQWTWADGQITCSLRIFNEIESPFPSDSIGPVTFACASAPGDFVVGSGNSTKRTQYDTVRLWAGNSAWPAPEVPGGQAVLAPWSGDARQTSCRVAGLFQGYDVVGLGVSTASNMAGASLQTTQSTDASGWAKWTLTGLTAGTHYYYQYRDPSGYIGDIYEFNTLKAIGTPCTTKIAAGSCKHTTPSSTLAFNDIVTFAPDRVVDLGDFGYPNNLQADDPPLSHENSMAKNAQDGGRLTIQKLYCVNYITSDHDVNGHGPSNSKNFDDPRTEANLRAWENMVPALLVDARTPRRCRYRSEQEGNVRYIYLDTRSLDRTDVRDNGVLPTATTSTMLGAYQLGLLEADLTAASAANQLVVLFTDPAWNGTIVEGVGMVGGSITPSYSDKWPAYQFERDYISDFAAGLGLDMFIAHGDSHLIQQDDGTNEKNGFAVVCCGPFDQNMHAHFQESYQTNYPLGITEGDSHPQAQMYQQLTIAQSGGTITVTADARDCTGTTPLAPLTVTSLVIPYTGY